MQPLIAMKKLLLIFVLLFPINSYAIENWEIKKVLDNKFIEISSEGDVEGDKYSLLIRVDGECNTIEEGFTFFTTKNNPEIMLLPGKKIGLESLGHKIASEIIAVAPVLEGGPHMVWISNGAYDLDEHTKFIGRYEKNEVKLLRVFDDFEKKTGWEAGEFFSLTTNSWNLKNVAKAIKEGRKICLEQGE
jgi:hypothetical protein